MKDLAYGLMAKMTDIAPGGLPQPAAGEDALKAIINITFAIIGALTLLVIVVSGLRYITSAGDPEKTAKAKNGVVYALVGLVIAISAFAIVSFVVNRLDS